MTDNEHIKPLDLSRYEGHTPGPWKHQKLGEPANPYVVAVTAPPGYEHPQFTVAAGTPTGGQGWPAVGLAGRDPMESLINARLIADAPDLLAEVVKSRAENQRLKERVFELERKLLDKILSDTNRRVLGEEGGEA